MPWSADLQGGRFSDFTLGAKERWAAATKIGVTAGTNGMKLELRQQIERAGLGAKLGNAIGSKVYPPGDSLQAAGFIFPRGPKAEAIFDSFNRGVTITAKGGSWLAIPTAYAGHGNRGKKTTPEDFQQRTGIKLFFVKTKKPGVAVLIGESVMAKSGRARRKGTRRRLAQGRKVESLVFFVLIKQTRVPKRLDFEAVAASWADRIPELIERALPWDQS